MFGAVGAVSRLQNPIEVAAMVARGFFCFSYSMPFPCLVHGSVSFFFFFFGILDQFSRSVCSFLSLDTCTAEVLN